MALNLQQAMLNLRPTKHEYRWQCPYPHLPLTHPLNNEEEPREPGFLRRRGKTIAAILCLAAAIGVLGSFGRSIIASGGTDKSAKSDIVTEAYSKPIQSEAAHHPSVIAAIAFDQKLGASLAAIQKRLAKSKLTLDEKVGIETDMLKAIDLLLPLADDARNDVDAVIRVAEDIKFELKFAQKQHHATAELFRDRANDTATDQMRSINMQSAEWFDALAADVPRRQKLTDEFISELAVLRREVTDCARTLRDLKTAALATTAGPDPLPLSSEGRTFHQQVEKFLTVLKRYYEVFFVNGSYLQPSQGGKKP